MCKKLFEGVDIQEENCRIREKNVGATEVEKYEKTVFYRVKNVKKNRRDLIKRKRKGQQMQKGKLMSCKAEEHKHLKKAVGTQGSEADRTCPVREGEGD